VNWTEPEYPRTLLQIYDPPVLFYLRGDPQILNMPCLSIVGMRWPTLYGSQMAERLGRDLAACGLVILSAMARGVDAIGHHGTLASNGRAISMLGTITQKKTRSSRKKILERGAILREFPLGTHPAPENFPIRNRIVAGMPLG
jgi:DNA processing protein